jgi:hypothetical protein
LVLARAEHLHTRHEGRENSCVKPPRPPRDYH